MTRNVNVARRATRHGGALERGGTRGGRINDRNPGWATQIPIVLSIGVFGGVKNDVVAEGCAGRLQQR
jgi:hypothetical protein